MQFLRLAAFGALIGMFLVAIELLGGSIGSMSKGQPFVEQLFRGLENPFAGLAVGVLATVLVQSSSATTSIIVAMVGAGTLPLAVAVPMVMGANIGTSITNTLVSLGHIVRSDEFRRAFAGATVHDFFNLMTVAILFPIEQATHLLQHSAEWVVSNLALSGAGGKFDSPIKAGVKSICKTIEFAAEEGLGLRGGWLSGALIVVAFALIMLSLLLITRVMRNLIADHIEAMLNRILEQRGALGILIGVVITVIVQSSSITTSLLVPMFGAGVLTLEAGFPIMLGANIGTTVTALIAAMVAGEAGLTIALVHLLFNCVGTVVFYPARRVPIYCARRLADLAVYNRFFVVVYIGIVFFVVPIVGILIWKV